MNVFWGNVFAEVGAENVLVPYECKDCRFAERPVEMPACPDAIHVGPVEVLAERRAAHEFKVIIGAVPEDLWREMEFALRFCADAGH